MRTSSVLLCLLSIALAQAASAAPNTVHVSLVTYASGAPYAGAGAIKFALVDGAGETLWTHDGTSDGEPAGSIPVPARPSDMPHISVALGDPGARMAPLTPEAIRANARLRVWFAAEGQPFELLTPDLPLASVPNALTANRAETLDGLVANQFGRAPFRKGFGSGMPDGSFVRILVDGQPTDFRLSNVPIEDLVPVVEHVGGEGAEPVKLAGPRRKGLVTLYRPVDGDQTWYEAFDQTRSERVETLPVAIVLYRSDEVEVARWTFSNCWVSSYQLRQADDNRPVEEVVFVYDEVTRTGVGPKATGRPDGGFQEGFESGLPPEFVYQFYLNDVPYPAHQIVSTAGGSVAVITYQSGGGSPPVRIPGVARSHNIVVRSNPEAGGALFNLYREVAQRGTALRSPAQLRIASGALVLASYDMESAWPCRWVLRTADDGSLVEEIEFAVERFERHD